MILYFTKYKSNQLSLSLSSIHDNWFGISGESKISGCCRIILNKGGTFYWKHINWKNLLQPFNFGRIYRR